MFGAAQFQTPEILETSRVRHALRAYSLQALHVQNQQGGNGKPCHKFRPIDVFKSAAYKSHLSFLRATVRQIS